MCPSFCLKAEIILNPFFLSFWYTHYKAQISPSSEKYIPFELVSSFSIINIIEITITILTHF